MDGEHQASRSASKLHVRAVVLVGRMEQALDWLPANSRLFPAKKWDSRPQWAILINKCVVNSGTETDVR
jgi:hypothetical protein